MTNFRKPLIAGIVALSLTLTALAVSPSSFTRIIDTVRAEFTTALLGDLSQPAPVVDNVTANISSFHFLEPLATRSGDFSKFDPSLLNYLTVDVCEVSSSDCRVVTTFTSSNSSSAQLRITTDGGNSYYLVNWDTSKFNLGRKTYRVRVTTANLQLGSVDLTPDVYTKFGRTWPIKFLIEKDPVIRVRLLRYLGKSA